jgi:flavin-dependent dehydrogenase
MYDVIIVGARCAGSPTAALLAGKGYKVLLLDRATFPSDMPFSTHYVHQTGAARLKRWGLLHKLAATGCPAITSNHWDYGSFTLSGSPTPAEDGVTEAYAPRRKALDPVLVEAAVSAGAELREGFSVQELLWQNDGVIGIRGRQRNGAIISERARLTIGADGMFSVVAKAVKAPEYNTKPPLEGAWYSYWSGLKLTGWHLWLRPWRVIFAYNTNDNVALVGVAFAARDLTEVRTDVERYYRKTIDEIAPDLAEQMRSGRREARFVGGAIPGYLRKPYGPGWALVGDAGYQKDPCTASGITDAFAAAELLSEAIDDGFAERQPLEHALAAYERRRNEAELPYYELTCQLATFEPPPPEMQQLLAALVDNLEQRSRFFGAVAHTFPVTEFFSPENMQKIIAGSGRGTAVAF